MLNCWSTSTHGIWQTSVVCRCKQTTAFALARHVLRRVAGLSTAADHVIFSRNIHEVRAYNRLARQARAPLIAFVQDDVGPPTECAYIQYMEAMFRGDAKMAIVGWRMFGLLPMGLKAWRTRNGAKIRNSRRFSAKHRWPNSSFAGQYAAWVDVGPLIVRRRAFMSLGAFDEAFSYPGQGAQYLDVDLALRAWTSGWRVAKFDSNRSGTRVLPSLAKKRSVGTRGPALRGDADSRVAGYRQDRLDLFRPWYRRIAEEVCRLNQGLPLWVDPFATGARTKDTNAVRSGPFS